MYNIYIRDVQNQRDNRELTSMRMHKKINNRLLESYRKRISLLLSEPRSSPTNTIKKPEKFFRFKPRVSRERISDSIEKTKWLDTSPSSKPVFQMRKRTRSKEINSEMRFKPKDRFERLNDVWKYQRNVLNLSWEPDKFSEKFNSTVKKSYSKTLETIANNQSKVIFTPI